MGIVARPYKSVGDVAVLTAAADKEIITAPIRFAGQSRRCRRAEGELNQLNGLANNTNTAAPINNSFSFGFGLNDLLLVQKRQQPNDSDSETTSTSSDDSGDSLNGIQLDANGSGKSLASATSASRLRRLQSSKHKSDGSPTPTSSLSSSSSLSDETKVRLLSATAASSQPSQLRHYNRNNLNYFGRLELLKNRRQYKSLATTSEVQNKEDYAEDDDQDEDSNDDDDEDEFSCKRASNLDIVRLSRNDICVHLSGFSNSKSNSNCKQDLGARSEHFQAAARSSPNLAPPTQLSYCVDAFERPEEQHNRPSGRRTRRLVSWTALKRQVRLRNSNSNLAADNSKGGGGGARLVRRRRMHPPRQQAVGHTDRDNDKAKVCGAESLVASDALRNLWTTSALEREKNDCIVQCNRCERHNWLGACELESNKAAPSSPSPLHCCTCKGGSIKLDADDDIGAAVAVRVGTCCAPPDLAAGDCEDPKCESIAAAAAVRNETTAAPSNFRCRVSNGAGAEALTSASLVDTCCKDAKKSSSKSPSGDERAKADSANTFRVDDDNDDDDDVGQESKFNVVARTTAAVGVGAAANVIVGRQRTGNTIATSAREPMPNVDFAGVAATTESERRVVSVLGRGSAEREQQVQVNESNLGGDANIAPMALAVVEIEPAPHLTSSSSSFQTNKSQPRQQQELKADVSGAGSSSSWRLYSKLVPTASGSYDLAVELGGSESKTASSQSSSTETAATAIGSSQHWRQITPPPEVTAKPNQQATQQVNAKRQQQQQQQQQQWRLARPGRSPMSLARQTSTRLARHRLNIQKQRQEQLAALARRERLSLTTGTTFTSERSSSALRQSPAAAATASSSLDDTIDVIDSVSETGNDLARQSQQQQQPNRGATGRRATGGSIAAQQPSSRHHAARTRPTSGAQWHRLSYERRPTTLTTTSQTGAREISEASGVFSSVWTRLAQAATFGYFGQRADTSSLADEAAGIESRPRLNATGVVCVDLRGQVRASTTTTAAATSRRSICDNSANEMYRSVVDCDLRPVASANRKKSTLMTTRPKSAQPSSGSNCKTSSKTSKGSNNQDSGDDDDEKSSTTTSARSESSWSLEGRPFCKICHTGNSKLGDRLISPCKCAGTMRYVHCGCLLKWLELSNRTMEKPMSCELCSHEYTWHKRFNFKHMQLPTCSLKDMFLHLLFILSICSMLYCALAPLMTSSSLYSVKKQQVAEPAARSYASASVLQQSAATSQSDSAPASGTSGELSSVDGDNGDDSIERFVEELIGKKRRNQQQNRQKQQVKQTNANSNSISPQSTSATSTRDAISDGFGAETQSKNTATQQQKQQKQQHSAALFTNGYTNHLSSNGRLASDEKLILISAAAFFVSFFLAIYVQTKTRDTLYGLCVRFVHMNRTYYITEYNHEQDSNNSAFAPAQNSSSTSTSSTSTPSSSSTSSNQTSRAGYTCGTGAPPGISDGYYPSTNGFSSFPAIRSDHSVSDSQQQQQQQQTRDNNNRNGNCFNNIGNNVNNISANPNRSNTATRLNHFAATPSNSNTTAPTTNANKYSLH